MLFDRVVCGVDGSPVGSSALETALRLLAPGGRLVAVTARHLPRALLLGPDGAVGAAAVANEALEAHAAAKGALAGVPHAEARLVDGDPATCLLAVAEQERANLLAIGARPHGRPSGFLLGRVDTTLLHRASCPVLVARPRPEGHREQRIVVGLDGSAPSLRALDLARTLARRSGAELLPLVARGAAGPPPAAGPGAAHDRRGPVDALVAASEEADLLVVGSRGTRGLASLGSVSERVAHAAACSVLVVRPTPVETEAREAVRVAVRPVAAGLA